MPTNSATNAVASSPAMFPPVTAETVVFDRGFGGWLFRHTTILLRTLLFEATAKTTSSARRVVAASSTVAPSNRAKLLAVGSKDAFRERIRSSVEAGN